MPLKSKEISALRNEFKQGKSREENLKIIAKKEAKEVLPVVTYVLKEIQTKQNSELTVNYLKESIRILEETIEKRAKASNLFKTITVLSSVKPEDVKNGLTQLVASGDQIEVTNDTAELWEEVANGLEGIFKRVDDKDKRKRKEGSKGALDWEDTGSRQVLHLSKLDIVTYYHRLAEIIYKKLAQVTNKQQVNDDNANTITTTVQTEPTITQSLPVSTQSVLKEESQVSAELTPDMPKDEIKEVAQETSPRSRHSLFKAKQEIAQDRKEFTLELLEKYKKCEEDAKFTSFIAALKTHRLNEDQENALKLFRKTILSKLDEYPNKLLSATWRVPTKIRDQQHNEEVKKYRNEIDKCHDIADILTNVHNLYLYAISQDSKRTKTYTQQLMNEAFEIAHANAKPSLLIIKPS